MISLLWFVHVHCVLGAQIATGGARSKDFFDKYGDLKRIRRLKFWSLDQLLVDKYKFPVTDAREFSEFLVPLLDFAPEKRPTAQQCLQHPWLTMRKSSAQSEMSTTNSDIRKVEARVRSLDVRAGKWKRAGKGNSNGRPSDLLVPAYAGAIALIFCGHPHNSCDFNLWVCNLNKILLFFYWFSIISFIILTQM